MDLIVAVTSDWGIGKGNDLLVHIPEDMRFFREKTKGSVVIMGRRTLESFPGGNPLKGRVNIVFTRDESYAKDGVVTVGSLPALFSELSALGREDVFVIGGGEIYSLLLPYCRRAYVTKVGTLVPASVYFPNIDKLENWKLTYESEEKPHDGVSFRFTTYENSSVKSVKK